MSSAISKEGDVCIVKVRGGFARNEDDPFRESVERYLSEDVRDFVVDLSECERLDSVGLEMLTWLKRQCQERLGMAKLCSLDEDLRKILEITRLDKELDVCEDVREAIAALK